MYLEYFNLKEDPFNITPNPRFLYLSKQHEVAIASLIYGIKNRKGFMVLTGEVGTGKSTLCREFINRLKKEIDLAVVLNPLLSVEDLMKVINRDFGNFVKTKSMEGQLEALNQFLLRKMKHGRNAVLLIDESQNLTTQALEMMRLLSNLETDQQKLLQIVLVGQPELEVKLKSNELRQLNQRISIRCKLVALNLLETKIYVYHRLSVVGGQGFASFKKRSLKFEDSAFSYLYKVTNGYPRMINIVCDRSLLGAYSLRTRVVTKEIIRTAFLDVKGVNEIKRKSWFGSNLLKSRRGQPCQ